MCLVALALKKEMYLRVLGRQGSSGVSRKILMCISRNVPTCAWCFGVHTKNIGGGVISTEVYPMIVEGAAILIVSSEGGVIVVHTKQPRTRSDRRTI